MGRRPQVAAGATVAYVSDAGTPGVADPGSRLVAEVAARGLRVTAVPRPSAALCALGQSRGLATERFCVEGLPPRARGPSEARRLEALRAESAARRSCSRRPRGSRPRSATSPAPSATGARVVCREPHEGFTRRCGAGRSPRLRRACRVRGRRPEARSCSSSVGPRSTRRVTTTWSARWPTTRSARARRPATPPSSVAASLGVSRRRAYDIALRRGPRLAVLQQRRYDAVVPRFYLTTPIYYVNDAPHLGHAYTHGQRGRDHRDGTGCSGTDEVPHRHRRARGQDRRGGRGSKASSPIEWADRNCRAVRRGLGGPRRRLRRLPSGPPSRATRRPFRHSFPRSTRTGTSTRAPTAGLYCVEFARTTTPLDGFDDGLCPIHYRAVRRDGRGELVLRAECVPGPPRAVVRRRARRRRAAHQAQRGPRRS